MEVLGEWSFASRKGMEIYTPSHIPCPMHLYIQIVSVSSIWLFLDISLYNKPVNWFYWVQGAALRSHLNMRKGLQKPPIYIQSVRISGDNLCLLLASKWWRWGFVGQAPGTEPFNLWDLILSPADNVRIHLNCSTASWHLENLRRVCLGNPPTPTQTRLVVSSAVSIVWESRTHGGQTHRKNTTWRQRQRLNDVPTSE